MEQKIENPIFKIKDWFCKTTGRAALLFFPKEYRVQILLTIWHSKQTKKSHLVLIGYNLFGVNDNKYLIQHKHVFKMFFPKTNFAGKIVGAQRDSNLDRQSRRQTLWPPPRPKTLTLIHFVLFTQVYVLLSNSLRLKDIHHQYLCCPKKCTCFMFTFECKDHLATGSGCSSVGRAVYCQLYWKDENKENEAGNDPS